MAQPLDTGGIPTTNDIATAITIQQSVGGAARGASTAVMIPAEQVGETKLQKEVEKEDQEFTFVELTNKGRDELKKIAKQHGIKLSYYVAGKTKKGKKKRKNLTKDELLSALAKKLGIEGKVSAEQAYAGGGIQALPPPLPPKPDHMKKPEDFAEGKIMLRLPQLPV